MTDFQLAYSMRRALAMAQAYRGTHGLRVVWQERAADYRETLVDRMRRRQGWSLREVVAGCRLAA